MYMFATLTAIGLAPLVLAAPQSSQRSNTTSIPLIKRYDHLNADKSINYGVLDSHITSIETKIVHGFDNYEKNTGVRSHHVARKLDRRREAIPLLQSPNNPWYGIVRFGNLVPSHRSQSFLLAFDTASGDLFIPSTACDSSCDGHTRWDSDRSRTTVDLNKRCQILYSDGTGVYGILYTDIVSLDSQGLSAADQTFCSAVRYPPTFQAQKFEADGIIGMGFQSISSYDATPIYQNLFDQGEFTIPAFSFKLAEYGELYLGGSNGALYTGFFTFVSVMQKNFWLVKMDNVIANNRLIAGGVPAIIDTGSIVIAAPTSHVSALQDALFGIPTGENGIYIFPCTTSVPVVFSFGGSGFAIPAYSLSLGQVSPGSSHCISAVIARDLIPGQNIWVIGEPFLKNVYTTFEFPADNPRVGFAQLRV